MTARERWITFLAAAALVSFPVAARAVDQLFYVGFATRVLSYALAATSLNLLLGYAGMISFGHAAYLGAGAYTVAILANLGVSSPWGLWAAAAAVAALVALLFGAVCVRTRGAYFIMITLAFSQMLYYVFVSARGLGGEDGFNLPPRSRVWLGVDFGGDVASYGVVLALFGAALFLQRRLVRSRYGRVLRAIRENETRAEAVGFPTFGYRLLCFVLAGAAAGLAGALLADRNGFVSPSLLHWSQSGTLMVMVILGGVGHPCGGLIGATVYLVLEEVLSRYTIHWQFGLGFALLAIVLFARHGVAGLLGRAPDG